MKLPLVMTLNEYMDTSGDVFHTIIHNGHMMQ